MNALRHILAPVTVVIFSAGVLLPIGASLQGVTVQTSTAASVCGPTDVVTDLGNGKTQCTDQAGNSTIVDSSTGVAVGGTNATLGVLAADGTPKSGGCFITSFSFSDCIWLPLMSWLGSWFLTIGGALLRLAGALFDTLILKVVVGFKDTLDALNITNAINSGWTVFRDFSNILIIGIFVFIAISIILGLQEFGQKKLIARVLIVAVLINFSLLFTKIIIDGSNFVSYQIYNQVAGSSGSITSSNKDIAQAFLRPMGIDSVWNTKGLTDAVAAGSKSGLQAFAFGLIGGILLLAVALVLFYGCFLIAARAVLFIFLMLTAALAFATYLVPSFANGEYGWSSWWKALINSAIFAPLLMLFLAVSMVIINAAGKLTACGSSTCPNNIGAIINDPSQLQTGNGWSAILIYILGIGLLFLSLRMSSKFAGTLSGLNMAAFAGSLPLRALALGGAGAVGLGLRNSAGRFAATRSQNIEAQMKSTNLQLANPNLDAAARKQLQSQMVNLNKQKARLDGLATRDFNLLSNTIGKKIAQPLGIDPTKSKGGFAGPRKEAAEKAAKDASAFTVSKTDAAAIAKEAVASEQKGAREQISSQKQASEALVSAARQLADAEKKQSGHQDDLERAVTEASRATQQKNTIEQGHLQGIISKAQRDQQLQEEDSKIKNARAQIVTSRAALKAIDDKHLDTPEVKQAQNTLREAEQRLGSLNKEAAKRTTELTQKVVDTSLENATSLATEIHHLDPYSEKIAGKEIRKAYGNKRMADALKALQEDTGTTPKPEQGSAGGTTT